jgi:hypothetical protein
MRSEERYAKVPSLVVGCPPPQVLTIKLEAAAKNRRDTRTPPLGVHLTGSRTAPQSPRIPLSYSEETRASAADGEPHPTLIFGGTRASAAVGEPATAPTRCSASEDCVTRRQVRLRRRSPTSVRI